MSTVTASPTTAWTTGQSTPNLGDATKAHWSGTGWVAGLAATRSTSSSGK